MPPGKDVQESSEFCLKWDGFHSNITSVFENLRQDEELVDITLCCEGRKLKAHKMMLSAASPFFRDLLKENPCQHPVFFLRDTRCSDMAAIVEFVYRGCVNVSQAQLASFFQTAELLQIRGLSGEENDRQKESRPSSADPVPTEPPPAPRPSRGHRPAASPPATPRRYRAAPPASARSDAATPASPRPGAATPPAKRRRVSTPPPPPPPPPPELPEVQEVLVKQEKAEESEQEGWEGVYDPAVQSSLEQMMLLPQHPRVMTTSTPAAGALMSTPPTPANPSEDPSQASTPPSRGAHECPVCRQKYWSMASLNNHISLHRGNTMCPICGQTCSTTSNRNRHMANKHAVYLAWRNAGAVDAAGGVSGGGGGGGAGGSVGAVRGGISSDGGDGGGGGGVAVSGGVGGSGGGVTGESAVGDAVGGE